MKLITQTGIPYYITLLIVFFTVIASQLLSLHILNLFGFEKYSLHYTGFLAMFGFVFGVWLYPRMPLFVKMICFEKKGFG